MPRKENTKAKTWERDRRKRMNGYFKNLSDLLPPQLEGRKRNKIDILIHASKYIKDLQSRTDELFHARASEVHKEELARLKRLVSQLVSRTQLLTDLLKNAGITVPAEPALEKISPLKWSNKINVVSGSKVANKIETNKRGEKKKERCSSNIKTNLKKKVVKVKRAEKPPVHNKCFPEKSKCTIEDQENHVNSDPNEKDEKSDKSSSSNQELLNNSTTEVFSLKPDTKNHKKVKRKKKNAPKTTIINSSKDINNLPAGTLVFSNGKIMPVVTPMQSLTSNIIVNAQSHPANPIILNNTQQGQMIVVQPLQTNHFQSVSTVQTMTLNTVPNIQTNMLINPQDWAKNVKTIINSSKIGGMKGILPKIREVTETTMTYKVPIPAIHKEKSENRNETKTEKQVKIKKDAKLTKTNKSNLDIQNNLNETAKKNISNSNNKLNVTKQALKRNINANFNEVCEIDKKKIKLNENENENENENKNMQISSNVVTDNKVICESIENMKQVIQKIGDDSHYNKTQISNSSITITNSKNVEVKNDINSLIELKNGELNDSKCQENKSECLTQLSIDEKRTNFNVSNTSKILSEKEECNIPSITEQAKIDFVETNENKIIEGTNENHSLKNNEIVTETQIHTTTIEKVDVQLSTVECDVEDNIILSNETNPSCNIETGLNNMLQSSTQNENDNEQIPQESNKIFLNLDTNTTTTMKLESSETKLDLEPPTSLTPTIKVSTEDESIKLKNNSREDQNIIKTVSYSPSNSFVPINHKSDSLHSDLSNDIFASLQVPSSSNNSESISPTAAFLMAFPIVSSLSGKTEVLDDEMKDDFKYSSQTPPMLLQIGTIEPNSFKLNSRTTANENLETESSVVNVQPQVKSSSESITPITNSTSITTPIKALPRVISSQTLTESFKIIPISSEQMNKQLNPETNDSLQVQTNSNNETQNSNLNNVNRDVSPTISSDNNRAMNSNQNYALDNKAQSNFNYSKDLSLTSISNSMANDILNKYISTTSLSTNTMATETLSKYNSISHYVTQDCQTSVPECSKETIDRNNSLYNFPCQSTNDIPTEKDLYKLQICPIEAFTDRSNEYSGRNKDNSFPNTSIQTTNPESLNKNIQVTMNQDKSSKVTIENSHNISSNNSFNSIKKVENKVPPNNSQANIAYHKKTNDVSNTNSYIGPCDNKINKKMINVSSELNNPGQKNVSSTSNTFLQQSQPYIVSTNYEESNIARSTTTVANTSSNFSILSWTTFSPLSSNNSNFPQYEQAPITTESSKNICDNFNYLPLSKENISLTNNAPQPTYSAVESQVQTYDKTKLKLSVDAQKRSYSDVNKSRNMRLSQTISTQKSTRMHNQPPLLNTDYKFSTENKNKYKYPMDMDFSQNNYSSGLDLAPHLQHNQQQNQHNQQNHQASSIKGSSNQSIQPMKSDKSNYMLPDYDSHANFTSDSNNIQSRYSNNNDSYVTATFKYGEKSQQIHPKYQSQITTSTLHQENSLYSNKHVQHQQSQSGQSKSKSDQTSQVQTTQQQQQQQQQIHQQPTMRPPVNWMMTPEVKHNSNFSDMILPPIGKELDFCQNNIFSQTSYNQTSTNQFYNNYDMSTHTFSNIPALQSEPKRNMDTIYYPEEQAFSWSPTKNLTQSVEQNQGLKNVETPTMPSLVGEIALGTNISDKQNFLFGQMPVRTSTNELSKESLKDKESVVSNRDYQSVVNNQNVQQNSSHGMPFLSVSQLVDHEKVDKSQHQQHHNVVNHHHGIHHHHHQNHHHQSQQQQQPQQQQQQHTSRKQRKNNSSPRASAKRQLDMRQKQSNNANNDHIHRHHEEPKTSTSGFADSNYQQQQQPQQQQQQQQQQKYNQQNNDIQWRSRNCKSNYTAEALIGSNNSHADNNHVEKNLPKYSTNYSQNKFSGSLATDPMSINYFPNVEDGSSGYGQVVNQNFNHSYTYTSNGNIYPSSNFITNISNSSTNYMMSLHENTADYLDSNNFLLPNVSSASISSPLLGDGTKSHHHHAHHHHTAQPYKNQNCDKRLYFTQQKKSKRKVENSGGGSGAGSGVAVNSATQNFDFPLSGIASPLDDFHHASTFLAPPNPLYQNQANVYPKTTLPPPPAPPPPAVSAAVSASSGASGSQGQGTQNNPMAMTQHHPSGGTSLTNFNLSTIFPEINDKVAGYKSSTNAIAAGITQSTSHTSTSYSQRTNYTDPLDPMSQASESSNHFNNTGSR